MRTNTAFSFFILFSLFCLNTFAKSNDGVKFIKSSSFEEISELAYQQNKPIFIDFTARWCIHCKEMDKGILRDPEVAAYMNQTFINYKVNVDKNNGKLLSLLYEIQELPTMVFVMPDGSVILKTKGLFSKNSFLNTATDAHARYAEKVQFLRLFSSYLPDAIFHNTPSNDYRPQDPLPFLPTYFIPEEPELYSYTRSEKVMRF